MPLEIASEFGYVVAAVGACFVPLVYGAVRVARARKAHGVEYPDLYAPPGHEKKKQFDCVQRGHQNTLENYAPVIAMGTASGLAYPRASAILLCVWAVGRVEYIRGYATGDPAKRRLGGLVSHLADVPLFFMTFFAAKKILDA
jgi:glutathione S-transferase